VLSTWKNTSDNIITCTPKKLQTALNVDTAGNFFKYYKFDKYKVKGSWRSPVMGVC
jgi:hypothetical protein